MAAVDQHQVQKQVAVMFFAFFLFPKFLELTGVWLYSLAQEAVPSATDESLEEVNSFISNLL